MDKQLLKLNGMMFKRGINKEQCSVTKLYVENL